MHIFIAIYNILCLQKPLFTCFSCCCWASGLFAFFNILMFEAAYSTGICSTFSLGTFSESLLFFDCFFDSLVFCPQTNPVVFAGFVAFYSFRPFGPKRSFGILRNFTAFDNLCSKGWGMGGRMITSITTLGTASS